ncbi:MAG: insulinase family protein [Phycisphaerales bacterium]|nr:insulinase family protein [Phycisphaerales bacterium]
MTTIHRSTIATGATLLVESNPAVESAALVWLVPAGAAHDPVTRLGLSALWAELLLRGSKFLDSRAQADAFDRLGAARSARLSSRFMTIGATSLGANLPDALPLIADMILAPRFDEASIDPSRELCLQAIEALKDDPGERAGIAAKDRHLPPPFNRSTLGTTDGLNAVTAADIRERWKALAVPRASIIAVAGRVDAREITDRLETLLAHWTGSADEPTPAAQPPRGYGHETDKSNQVQIVLMHDAPAETSAGSILEKLVVSVLSGGMSSRLFTEIREKRALCYSVHARYSTDRDFGLVAAEVGTQPERAQESLDVLVAELHKLSTPEGRVTPEEFRRAVVGMKSRLVFSGESTGARASALATDMFRLGRPRSLAEVAAEIDAITLDQLNAYLARRSMGTLTIQTVGPDPLTPPA